MKRAISALLVFLLLGGVVVSEARDPGWLDPWREATVALGVVQTVKVRRAGKVIDAQFFKVIGTGVLFPKPDEGAPVLITAKHVFFNPAKNWNPSSLRLRFAWFEGRAVDEYLGIEVPLHRDGKPVWVAHPTADVAGMRLRINKADAGREYAPSIPPGNFADADDIYEGAGVLALGYPGAVGASYWTRALVRGGTVAWVDPKNAATEPLLVDAMLFPGNSGGPVIKVPIGMQRTGAFAVGNTPKFLGIVSRGRTEKMQVTVGGQPVEFERPEGRAEMIAEQFIGAAVIEPAARVAEVMKLVP
jgi:hypothetical protein